jgi:hypothetical protein
MSKDTIRKIKWADNALMISVPVMIVGMQGWTVAAVVEDRGTKRFAASLAWFTLAAVPIICITIADLSFMVILGAFTTFLESATRLELSSSTGPPKGDADGAGAGQGRKKQSRRESSFFMFGRASVAPDSSLRERPVSKSESVTRIEKQIATLRQMRRMVPCVGAVLGVIGFTCAFSVSGAYAGKVGILACLAFYGLFLSTSTIMMYNLGSRKRHNEAKKRERQASRAAGAGGAPSTSAPSTAQSTSS